VSARRVVLGHAVGVLAGLLSYPHRRRRHRHHDVDGPGTIGGLRLAASGVAAVALTTGGMALTDSRHARACASIVGLGIFSTPRQGVLIVLAVGILVAEQELLARRDR